MSAVYIVKFARPNCGNVAREQCPYEVIIVELRILDISFRKLGKTTTSPIFDFKYRKNYLEDIFWRFEISI